MPPPGNGWEFWGIQRIPQTRVERRSALLGLILPRDIRPKSASDSEDNQLLGHLDARTLQKHYKRKPLKVKPLDMVGK